MDHLLFYQPDTGPTIVRVRAVVQCAVRCRFAAGPFDHWVRTDRQAGSGAALHSP